MNNFALRIAAAKAYTEQGLSCRDFPAQCHVASLKLVQSPTFKEMVGDCRVARGGCKGVPGQHSWVVIGMDCYDNNAKIVDPTLWSYDSSVPGLWVGSYQDGRHIPHGKGNIFAWGRPGEPTGPVIKLRPSEPLSQAAESFLELLGPLDREGWAVLAHAPVEGWPAGEILYAMENTPELTGRVPIDILGMITDLNPKGLYL